MLDVLGLRCALSFDYSKAFDSVPHKPLLEKLRAVNVNPYILKWIAFYLYNRNQYVRIGDAASGLQPVLSGFPQRSILGPLVLISTLMIASYHTGALNSLDYVNISLCR